MKARIHISLKKGVLDPQGKAIANTLAHLGFDGVEEVRQGKYIEIDLAGSDAAEYIDKMGRQVISAGMGRCKRAGAPGNCLTLDACGA